MTQRFRAGELRDNAVLRTREPAMSIWKQHADLATINAWSTHTLMHALDIRIDRDTRIRGAGGST